MSRDSDPYVKQCSVCNTNKKGNRTYRSVLECFHAWYPMERVHIDILGPINPKTKSGSSYILVMIDQFTKWAELAALQPQNAQLTAKAFLSHFVTTFGCPLEVHTDQGRSLRVIYFRHFANFWRSLRQGLHPTTHLQMVRRRLLTN